MFFTSLWQILICLFLMVYNKKKSFLVSLTFVTDVTIIRRLHISSLGSSESLCRKYNQLHTVNKQVCKKSLNLGLIAENSHYINLIIIQKENILFGDSSIVQNSIIT